MGISRAPTRGARQTGGGERRKTEGGRSEPAACEGVPASSSGLCSRDCTPQRWAVSRGSSFVPPLHLLDAGAFFFGLLQRHEGEAAVRDAELAVQLGPLVQALKVLQADPGVGGDDGQVR